MHGTEDADRARHGSGMAYSEMPNALAVWPRTFGKLQSEAKNMARTPRIKSTGKGSAYYHLISRCSNKQFLFRKEAAKDRLMDLARKAAEFSGVKLLALTVMDVIFVFSLKDFR